ncbi:MAG: acetate kinase, partial [Mangrovicoccus sp.]
MGRILTINAGSSSLKYSVYSSGDSPEELCNGLIEGIGSSHVQMTLKWQGDKTKTDIGEADHAKGVQAIIETIKPVLDGEPVTGVGHRVVHGGTIYEKPVKLDLQVVETLRQFEPFAPLHQPANLSGVLAAMEAFPDAVQIGCFDTAFHRGHPWVNDTFALPRKYYDAGIRRYGFHGLSYDYITTELARIDPGSYKDRIVVCH